MFIRNGDVVLRKIEKMPIGVLEKKTNILALGEFTGHSHTLVTVEDKPMNIFTDTKGNLFIDISEKGYLKHQEHKTIEIDPGQYSIQIKRNYNPFSEAIEKVRD